MHIENINYYSTFLLNYARYLNDIHAFTGRLMIFPSDEIDDTSDFNGLLKVINNFLWYVVVITN